MTELSEQEHGPGDVGIAAEEAWWQTHDGHDVAMRHDSGSLASATCYDCNSSYWRVTP